VPSRTAGDAPDNNLVLKWAHGFRAFDTRGNLKYTSEGKVAFSTAGVGVVQDVNLMEQYFFNQHKEDIVAMAIHPNKEIIATGQMAGKALNEKVSKASAQGKLVDIYVWNASTREIITKIFGFHRRAVR